MTIQDHEMELRVVLDELMCPHCKSKCYQEPVTYAWPHNGGRRIQGFRCHQCNQYYASLYKR